MSIVFDEVQLNRVLTATGFNVTHQPEFRSEMERTMMATWGSGGDWQPGACKVCGKPIDGATESLEMMGTLMEFTYGACEHCADMVRSHYSRGDVSTQQVSRTPLWDEQCPPLYKDLLENLPERINRRKFDKVNLWRPSQTAKGLILTGDSGLGKTTALWGLFKGLEIAENRPLLLTAVELQRQLSQASRDIRDVKHLTHCRVLMIDDLGKEKLTASVAALLWEIIDSRYANRRAMIISTRYEGKDFEARFGDPVLGVDIRRRLGDCCTHVSFKQEDR
jgi:hypothetical protein